mmetsp:Transcript_38429/g.75786  ORF Transcript_38429/g.75786 Transcript_38429/m.75786 type:complete len:246 (+) Transcript_38429:836-1573(+)
MWWNRVVDLFLLPLLADCAVIKSLALSRHSSTVVKQDMYSGSPYLVGVSCSGPSPSPSSSSSPPLLLRGWLADSFCLRLGSLMRKLATSLRCRSSYASSSAPPANSAVNSSALSSYTSEGCSAATVSTHCDHTLSTRSTLMLDPDTMCRSLGKLSPSTSVLPTNRPLSTTSISPHSSPCRHTCSPISYRIGLSKGSSLGHSTLGIFVKNDPAPMSCGTMNCDTSLRRPVESSLKMRDSSMAALFA